MPDILAIHWERRRLRIVEASVGSSVRIIQAFTVDIPETLATGWLRDALRKHGTSARQAIVGLSREDAMLRQLELPNAPEDELPPMVQFQASTRSTTPLDQLLLDFMPLPSRPGAEQIDVLLATVAKSALEPMRAALTEAGVDLVSLTLGSFALAELVMRAEAVRAPSTRRSLVVLEDANRLEVVLLADRQPLVSHLIRPPLDDQGRPVINKAAADISRVLVPAQPWLTEAPLERIWILGDSSEWQGFDRILGDRWNCPVERLDVQSKPAVADLDTAKLSGPLSQFTPAIGLALTRVHRLSPGFDLLHPRQARPKSDPRKLQLAVGAAAATLVAALAMSYFQLTFMGLEDSIAKANDKERERKADLKSGEPDLNAAKLIGEWSTRDINQLQQFAELNDLMQGTSRQYLTEYNFGPASGEALAKLHAVGNARTRIDSVNVAQRLADSKHYRVKPSEVTQSRGDDEYPNRFELDTEIIPASKGPTSAGAAGSSTASKTK